MAHKVLAVANEFLDLGLKDGRGLTPMQIQKLCYLAHGFTLALAEHSLVIDHVEAWDFGPVFPTLYNALKRYGASAVPELLHENNWANAPSVRGEIVRDEFAADESLIVREVYDAYSKFAAFQLSALTHEDGTPWRRYYRPGVRNIEIPNEAIREYFSGLVRNADSAAVA